MPYDVAKRFQEVAKRARETGPVVNAAPKKKKTDDTEGVTHESFHKQMGTTHKVGRDVNLPIESASPEVRKRITGFGQMSNKEAQILKKAGPRLK